MTSLPPGLYESLITHSMQELMDTLAAEGRPPQRGAQSWDWIDDALARHVAGSVRKALADQPHDEHGIERRVQLVRQLLEHVADQSDVVALPDEAPLATRDALLWVPPPKKGTATPRPPDRPEHGLVHPSLLFNGRQDTQLLSELKHEMASADRIDAIVAFLKFSGFKLIEDALRRFLERGGELRLITSTYVGATDQRAVMELAKLHKNVRVRIAYEEDGTRLHAKAWLFHRHSGLSTSYIGSSNLSRSAMTDGAEWNVRVTQKTTPALLERFETAFDQFWEALTLGDFRHDEHADTLKRSIDRARGKGKDSGTNMPFLIMEPEPKPHQEPVLDALAAERERGHRHNLVVAATGTGKTWVSAFDYKRLRSEGTVDTLLFVAHRKEILTQSLMVFRTVLQDPGFGELYVGGEVPERGTHVFASIQSLRSSDILQQSPSSYDMVIVDEFHHAAASSYDDLLDHVEPAVLLGLTATPERMDGKSILHWFDHRIAAEIRLWDALEQGLLAPFHYFGVWDPTRVDRAWQRGRLQSGELEEIYTADDARAVRVLQATQRYVCDPSGMRALGFCVGVAHAERMARAFHEKGLKAMALSGTTPKDERQLAVERLKSGDLQALFTVDLFNEGVDIPHVDTVLFLRPTESATVFLQQLGRGLRRHDKKAHLTVLDFVGHVHEDYRYELRFQAMLGGTRKQVADHIDHGFPKMPPGCAIELERQAKDLVLKGIRKSLRGSWRRLLDDLRRLGEGTRLLSFLAETGAELDDIYDPRKQNGLSWTLLRRMAGHEDRPQPEDEGARRRRLARMTHVDDGTRFDVWTRWLGSDVPPTYSDLAPSEQALARMLMVLVGDPRRPLDEIDAELAAFWAHTPLREELVQLLAVLDDRVRHTSPELSRDEPLPVRLHGTYTRNEVVAAWGVQANGRLRELREGVLWDPSSQTDLFFITLEKSDDVFKPSIRYADYPISAKRFHWESQNRTSEASKTGQRYVNHVAQGSRVVLFVRERNKDDRGETLPYTCLGYATYVSHKGERPMQIIWNLEHAMPTWVLQAATVAA